MSLRTWFRAPRVRRGVAASAIALAAGGLVLFRAPASARPTVTFGTPSGAGASAFSGEGARATLALSQARLAAGTPQRFFAELTLTADPREDGVRERAPISLAVAIDTSGSMGGEKIEQAKRSVIQLVREMRDDDRIALVRYNHAPELVQPLARVGDVRSALVEKVSMFRADGGTSIAPALERALGALDGGSFERVRRVVLVSDGLDSGRLQSERIARDAAERTITVSSMGIGLDFDEGYMGAIAGAGRGNFAFVQDGGSLASFLKKELDETAATTIENASAHLRLPANVELARAIGADAKVTEDGREVELRLGSLFAGDSRRVVLELVGTIESGETAGIEGSVRWSKVGGGSADVRLSRLEVVGTADEREAAASRDGAVLASATSVVASRRQLEAAEAWNKGDGQRAQALIDQNVAELRAAAPAAPAAAATALAKQSAEYEVTKRELAAAPPASTAGKVAAKRAAAKDAANLGRAMY